MPPVLTDVQRVAFLLGNPLLVQHDELLDEFSQSFAVERLSDGQVNQ